MPDAGQMPSQDPALDSFKEDILEGGHTEMLDNEERGCGHLQHNAAYVRCDVAALGHPQGTIPSFVALDTPVEYREYGGRGAIIPGWQQFPGFEFGCAYVNEGGTTTPGRAITEHHDRLAARLDFGGGQHYGEITAARSHDILMSVGATNYPDPEGYIEECRTQGLNLKIPTGPSNDPPVVNPMRTRCWVVHPNGTVDDRAAIIGYAVLTRTVYTTGEQATADDPDIPQYAKEWAETGKVSLATPGAEISGDEDPAQTGVAEWAAEAGRQEPDPEAGKSVVERVAEGDQYGDPEEELQPDVEPPEADEDPDEEPDEEPGGPSVTVVTQESGADHLIPWPNATDTLCGREFGTDAPRVERATTDSEQLAQEFDVCGTCLTALQTRGDA